MAIITIIIIITMMMMVKKKWMSTPEVPPQLGVCLSATQHLHDATPRQTLEKQSLRLMKKRWMEVGVFGKALTAARPNT